MNIPIRLYVSVVASRWFYDSSRFWYKNHFTAERLSTWPALKRELSVCSSRVNPSGRTRLRTTLRAHFALSGLKWVKVKRRSSSGRSSARPGYRPERPRRSSPRRRAARRRSCWRKYGLHDGAHITDVT